MKSKYDFKPFIRTVGTLCIQGKIRTFIKGLLVKIKHFIRTVRFVLNNKSDVNFMHLIKLVYILQ